MERWTLEMVMTEYASAMVQTLTDIQEEQYAWAGEPDHDDFIQTAYACLWTLLYHPN